MRRWRVEKRASSLLGSAAPPHDPLERRMRHTAKLRPPPSPVSAGGGSLNSAIPSVAVALLTLADELRPPSSQGRLAPARAADGPRGALRRRARIRGGHDSTASDGVRARRRLEPRRARHHLHAERREALDAVRGGGERQGADPLALRAPSAGPRAAAEPPHARPRAGESLAFTLWRFTPTPTHAERQSRSRESGSFQN